MGYKIADRGNVAQCLECGKAVSGRTDKVFCCKSCKNTYHNARAKHFRHEKKDVMRCLERNYKLLENLLMMRKTSDSLDNLKRQGYVDGLVTGTVSAGPHKVYACFDIVFSRSDARIFQIKRRNGR